MLKRLFKLGTLLLSVICIASFVGCASNGATPQQSSATKQSIRVGVSVDLEVYDSQNDKSGVDVKDVVDPYYWVQNDNSNGAVKIENSDKYVNGYDIRIAKKIAEGLGKELVVVNVEWEKLIEKVAGGEIDLIIAAMTPTSERKEKIDFSDPYYTSGFAFVVKNDGALANATKLSDFAGKKLASMSETFPYSLLDAVSDANKVSYDNFALCAKALKLGEIDAYLTEDPTAKLSEAKNTSFKAVNVTSELKVTKDECSIAVGMKKGSDLKSKVNSIISGISSEQRETLMNETIQIAK